MPSFPSLVKPWLGSGARRVTVHQVAVAASPERAYRSTLDLQLTHLPLTRVLFTLRGVRHNREMTILDLFTTPPFRLLEESTPHEIVFEVSRPQFRAVVNFRVDPLEHGSRVATATWIETWSWPAAVSFRAYWLIVGPFSGLIRREMLREARRGAERGGRG